MGKVVITIEDNGEEVSINGVFSPPLLNLNPADVSVSHMIGSKVLAFIPTLARNGNNGANDE